MIRKARKITDARFVEISAVDKPACDLATINAVRLAKRAEEAAADLFDFNPAAIEALGATPEEAGMLRKMFGWLFRKKELSTDSRNDLEDSKFAYIDSEGGRHLPIHDASHVRNALARFNQTKFESASAKAKAHAKIVAAAKKFGVEVSEKQASVHNLRKGLYDVGRLAEMVQGLDYMYQCTCNEREWEGDDSPVPEKIAEVRDTLGRILLEMAEEELSELKPAEGAE